MYASFFGGLRQENIPRVSAWLKNRITTVSILSGIILGAAKDLSGSLQSFEVYGDG